MVDFVVDKSIPVLFRQVNEMAPNRDKSSDGMLGDLEHSLRTSDHNPESPPPPGNPDDQVDAGDITHDPAHGADMRQVSEAIRLSRDVRVRYVIFNRRIFYSYVVNGVPAYTWQEYFGPDPHTGHMHLSVNDIHHDETQLWDIGADMNYNQDKILSAIVNLSPTMKLDTDTRIDGLGTLKDFPVELTLTVRKLQADMALINEKLDRLLAQGPGTPGGTVIAGTFTGTVASGGA